MRVIRQGGFVLVYKVLVLQVWGPEISLQNPFKTLGSIHLLPRLGRWRYGDPWGSLARQSSLIADVQEN